MTDLEVFMAYNCVISNKKLSDILREYFVRCERVLSSKRDLTPKRSVNVIYMVKE